MTNGRLFEGEGIHFTFKVWYFAMYPLMPPHGYQPVPTRSKTVGGVDNDGRVNLKTIRVCTCTDFVQGPNGILCNINLNPKYGFLNIIIDSIFY